jgi:hypothetical protein
MVTDAKTGQGIFSGGHSLGLRNVGSYQVSGHPYMTGSADLDEDRVHQVSFPFITKSVTVINNNSNSGEDLRVHMQSGSLVTITETYDKGGFGTISDGDDVIAGNHFITVAAGKALTLDVKCKNIFISNGTSNDNLTWELFAELTYIATGSMPHLTGSGITNEPG